jgi:hypothetical protein
LKVLNGADPFWWEVNAGYTLNLRDENILAD